MQTDWERVRRVIYERDGGICMKCGEPVSRDDFHVDHIIPISAGGSEWDVSNLELSCPACNLKKGAKIEERIFYAYCSGINSAKRNANQS